MIFNSIKVQNFLSIRNIDLVLCNQGLVLLNGKNLDNNSLNNNGAGKSSILEAIVYALYGRTLRGLKGDAVVHRVSGKNTQVVLDITDDDGTPYRIARYRKHPINKNKSLLYRNGVDITPKSEADFEKYITNLLQSDYSTFTASLLYSAESFKFSTATDGDIKKTFDTMLGLEVLSKALELTRVELRELTRELNIDRNKAADYGKQLEKLSEKEQQLQSNYENFDADKAAKIQQLEESILVLQEKIRPLEDECDQYCREIDDTNGRWDDINKRLNKKNEELQQVDRLKDELRNLDAEHNELCLKIKACNKVIDARNEEIGRLQKSINAAQIKINKLEQKKQELSQQIGQPCPTCGSPLTASKIEPARTKYNEDIQEIQDEIQSLQISVQKARDEIELRQSQIEKSEQQKQEVVDTKNEFQRLLDKCKGMESSRDELVKQLDKLKERLYQLRAKLQIIRMEKEHNDKLISQAIANLAISKRAQNPYEDLLVGVRQEISDVTQKRDKLLLDNKANEQREQGLKFWEMAYSNQGIKSLVLDDITPFLNRRVNRYLTKLAAGQIEAVFSTRTVLKSGGESERFSLTITNQDGGEQYSSNSSGEKKRIDLAINLALQDLVASRSSKKINIAIFDEVFDALDENGIDSVVSLLQELSQEKSTILVVTHNEHLKSYFNNCVTVVKENGFSYIEGNSDE